MLVLSISVAVFDGVASKGDGRMFLLTRQVQGYQQELLGCPCNHRQQWGWVRAALHPLVSCWDVGPRCAPAPGILQGNRVVRGSSGRGEGCAACARAMPVPVPSPCLCPCHACAQPLPAPLTASSALPLARCCPAFGVCALTDVLRKGSLWESQHGPFA